jgi:hypothetical protein
MFNCNSYASACNFDSVGLLLHASAHKTFKAETFGIVNSFKKTNDSSTAQGVGGI